LLLKSYFNPKLIFRVISYFSFIIAFIVIIYEVLILKNNEQILFLIISFLISRVLLRNINYFYVKQIPICHDYFNKNSVSS
jgi:hypothetical protein